MSGVVTRSIRIGVLVLSLPVLSGCSNYIFEKFDLDGRGQSLSVDAKQRLVLVTHEGGKSRDRKIVCAEPSPDAFSATAASASGSGAIAFPPAPGGGESSAGAALAAARSESAASLAMRTQTIQLLRDGLYRACEAYMNGAIDQHQYNILLVNINKTMVTLLGVDGIAGTQNVAPVAISATAPGVSTKAGLPPEAKAVGADGSVAPGGTVTINNTFSPARVPAPGAVQSEAIANIVMAVNSQDATPSLCISLLSSGEMRLDNPGQHSVMKSCDYLLNGVVKAKVHSPPHRAPDSYRVTKYASEAQQAEPDQPHK